MSGPYRGLIWETDQDQPASRQLTRPAIYLLLALAVIVLGLNWPVMTITLRSITPIWMAALRVAGAGIAVVLIGMLTGNLSMPPRRDLPMIVSVAVFRLAAVMVLVFFALRLVPAGRASVLVWTTSLWTVPIAAMFLGERISTRRWAGLVVGVSGVVILSEVWGNDWREPSVVVGTVLLILAAVVNASTAVHIRRHHWTINPLQALPWQLIGAAIPLTVLGLVVDGPPAIDWTPQLIWMMAYQSILASGVAFWAQIVVLRNLSAVSTNLTMTGVPVLGVVSSAVVLGEPVTGALVAGMALVLAGVAVNVLADQPADPVSGRARLPLHSRAVTIDDL